MKTLALLCIQRTAKGVVIKVKQLYSSIYSEFPDECRRLGFTASNPIEEKWKNEIRYGIWEARKQRLIKHVGARKSGTWERV